MPCLYGHCLVATGDLPVGTVVQRFEGPIIPFDTIPEEEICYILVLNCGDSVMIPRSDARYMNHGCDPNCVIDDDNFVRTIRPVQQGQELTFAYNVVRESENPGIWDPRWSFQCKCGSPRCQGTVDKYVNIDSTAWIPLSPRPGASHVEIKT